MNTPTSATALATLPDHPRWVEARSLLLHHPCQTWGVADGQPLAAAIRDTGGKTVFVIGRPPVTAVHAATAHPPRPGEVIAGAESETWLADVLPGWRRARILVHTLASPERLPVVRPGQVDWLDPVGIPDLAVDEELRAELEAGAELSPIATVMVAGQPVSFCYAGAVTERWWDVSIDTVLDQRGQGYAGLVATFMIQAMQGQGKQPVWQSFDDNRASYRLAAKLGFRVVDELCLFSR
jgi:hypothetical protein